jgi:putative transposase
MAGLLEVSASGYYHHSHPARGQLKRLLEAARLKAVAGLRATAAGRSYGLRRLGAALAAMGLGVSAPTLRGLLKGAGLMLKGPRRRLSPSLTDSTHKRMIYQNLAAGFAATAPGQLWVADTSWLTAGADHCYAAIVMDACSRMIVGYALADRHTSELCIQALDMALAGARAMGMDTAGIIHHSDRGCTYCSSAYRARLWEAGMRCSNTASGNPRENAQAERVISTLKHELGMGQAFATLEQARAALSRAVAVNNYERIHSALGYAKPAQIHLQDYLKKQATGHASYLF